MRLTGDSFIKLGFWSQLVLLGLVDWGTLVAFSHADEVPTVHYVGFALVNIMLLSATAVMWRWLKPARSPHLDG